MVRRIICALSSVALLSGCGSAEGDAVPPASMSPVTPPPGEVLLRIDAKQALDIERYDDWNRRWDFLCTTPCERVVPAVSAYRVHMEPAPGPWFTISSKGDAWMIVQVDPRGRAGTTDSPHLRQAHREAAAEVAQVFLRLASDVLTGR
jgi:hypothetical protein